MPFDGAPAATVASPKVGLALALAIGVLLAAFLAYWMFGGLGTNPDTLECANAAAKLLSGSLPVTKRFPLMILALTPFAPMGVPAELNAARAISLLALVGSGLMAFRIGQQLRMRMPILLSIGILCYWPLLNTVAQATVDGWHVFLLLTALYYALREKIGLAYLFAGLAAATRPESLFLPFALALFVMVRERKVLWKQVGIAFLCVLPTLAWVSLTLNVKKGYLDEVAHRGMAKHMVVVKAGSALVAGFGTLPGLRDMNEGSKSALLMLIPAVLLVGWLLYRGLRNGRSTQTALFWTTIPCVAGWLLIHTLFPFELAAHRYGLILYVLLLPWLGLGLENFDRRSKLILAGLCAVCLLPLFPVNPILTVGSLAVLGEIVWVTSSDRVSSGLAFAVPVAVLGIAVAVPKVMFANPAPTVEAVAKDLQRLNKTRVLESLTSATFVPAEDAVPEAAADLQGGEPVDPTGAPVDAMVLTQQDVDYAKTGHLRASTDLRFALYSRADQYKAGTKPYDLIKKLLADPVWKVQSTYRYSEHRTALYLYIRESKAQ